MLIASSRAPGACCGQRFRIKHYPNTCQRSGFNAGVLCGLKKQNWMKRYKKRWGKHLVSRVFRQPSWIGVKIFLYSLVERPLPIQIIVLLHLYDNSYCLLQCVELFPRLSAYHQWRGFLICCTCEAAKRLRAAKLSGGGSDPGESSASGCLGDFEEPAWDQERRRSVQHGA